MNYVPDWIFDALVGCVGTDYLSSDLPLQSVAKKYADGTTEKYHQVKPEEFIQAVETIVRFLDEVNAGDESVTFLRGFSYFRLHFEAKNKTRKLKPLFGAVDEPVKVKSYSSEESVKRFKAYVFALRSESAPTAPAGWGVADETDLHHIAEVASRPLSVLDSF